MNTNNQKLGQPMLQPYHQITHLLHAYAEHIDNGNFTELGELFIYGSVISNDGNNVAAGTEAVIKLYKNATRLYPDNGTPHTQHIVSNISIDIEADTSHAAAKSRFTVYQQLDDFPLQTIIVGRYEDTFQLIDAQWWFKERHIQPELYGDLSRHLLFDPKEIQQ
jgi:3-phenylpropionate/cinnamic acid dioxygenase small subunit